MQYGKVMRFVKVSFNGITTEEMQRRLYPAYTQPSVQNKPKTHKGIKIQTVLVQAETFLINIMKKLIQVSQNKK